MMLDKQLKKEYENDKSRVEILTKQLSQHEKIVLENRYLHKQRLDEIVKKEQASREKWQSLIKAANNTSTMLEPAEFNVRDSRGIKQTIKIGPTSSAHDVKIAAGMHNASKYEERKKKEIADWKQNQGPFDKQIMDILRKKHRILGVRLSDRYSDSHSSDLPHNPHANYAHTFHTSFRQAPSDRNLENEFRELSEQYRALDRERSRLREENDDLSKSLKTAQENTRMIAENRDEHAMAYNRFFEENQRLAQDLKSALKTVQELRMESPVHRVSFDGEKVDLKDEVQDLTKSLAKLKVDRDLDRILRDVGIESRIEFLQTSKAGEEHRIYQHSRRISMSSGLKIRPDPTGNISVGSSHRGNARADTAMLLMDEVKRARFGQTFLEIYGVTIDDIKEGRADEYAPQCKQTEIINLRGTMAHRGFFTSHTPDPDAEDQFLTLFEFCAAEYQAAIDKSPNALKAAQLFSGNPDIISACDNMRRICGNVIATTRIDSRLQPPYMSGGLS